MTFPAIKFCFSTEIYQKLSLDSLLRKLLQDVTASQVLNLKSAGKIVMFVSKSAKLPRRPAEVLNYEMSSNYFHVEVTP